MRLDVAQPPTGRRDHPGERGDLVEHGRLEFFGAHREVAPAESLAVRIAGMGADRHAGTEGDADRPVDDERVAGVEPAGDVDRADDRDEGLVRAHRPWAEALADIGVEVDGRALRCHDGGNGGAAMHDVPTRSKPTRP